MVDIFVELSDACEVDRNTKELSIAHRLFFKNLPNTQLFYHLPDKLENRASEEQEREHLGTKRAMKLNESIPIYSYTEN